MTRVKRLMLVGGFCSLLLLLVQLGWLFGLVTGCLSLLIFGRLEFEHSLHEYAYCFRQPPSPRIRRFYYVMGMIESVGRSLVFAILATFLFSGTDTQRMTTLATLFIVCVVLGYVSLCVMQRRAEVDAARWGYLRFSVLLGILFSVLSARVQSGSLLTSATVVGVQNVWGTPGIAELAEFIHNLTATLNGLIASALHVVFGSILGTAVSLAFSVHVVYGFVIVLYSLVLLHMVERAVGAIPVQKAPWPEDLWL